MLADEEAGGQMTLEVPATDIVALFLGPGFKEQFVYVLKLKHVLWSLL